MSTHETLGLLLVRDQVITRPQLYDALRLQRQNNRLLGTCLLALGYIDTKILLDKLSQQLRVPALPPGTVGRASPEAYRRVPRGLALRLRVVPYSWDGEMLGVAVADGRVLNHLQEVAYHTQSAVGAYVALETEIEATLRQIYPEDNRVGPVLAVAPSELAGRPRPARAEVTRAPASPEGAPAQLAQTASAPSSSPVAARADRLVDAPPQATPAGPAVTRLSLFEAVEHIYDADGILPIGRFMARALLNYFSRVVVLLVEGGQVRVVAHAGVEVGRGVVPSTALPLVINRLGQRGISYGTAVVEPRAAELASVLGFERGETALFGSVGPHRGARLVVFADNGDAGELYDEVPDVELLFKEAETGLAMLGGS